LTGYTGEEVFNIFLSYESDMIERVSALRNLLRRWEFHVWVDYEQLHTFCTVM